MSWGTVTILGILVVSGLSVARWWWLVYTTNRAALREQDRRAS